VAAITAAAPSAAALSGERVAEECRKLFGMADAAIGIDVLHRTGLDRAALGVSLDPARLDHLAGDLERADGGGLPWPDAAMAWLVRLAAVMPAASAGHLADRLRLSRQERKTLAALDIGQAAAVAASLSGPAWPRAAYAVRADGMSPAAVLAVAAARAGHDVTPAHLRAIHLWRPPAFPVRADDLMSQGVDKGPALGEMLRRLERHWVEQDFIPPRDELVAMAVALARGTRS